MNCFGIHDYLQVYRFSRGGDENKVEESRVMRVIEQTAPYTPDYIVDRYSVPVYRFCRSLTYSKEDAEDLFQETFIKAFNDIRKLNLADNPQSFLFSTALYIWKSWKRKYARRKRIAPVEPMDENIESGMDIENGYLLQEEKRLVKKLVNALPERFKVPTIMYYTLEVGISEIAVTLHIPEGTVKSRLHKARKLIEKGLVSCNDEKKQQ